MLEIIFLIVLFCSLAGMAILVYQKAPFVSELPEPLPNELNWKNSLNKMKGSLPFKDFSFETFLQKILSKIRILTLRTENKISSLLQRLRERAKKKKFEENGENSFLVKTWKDDNYWQKVKKFKKKKP